MTQLTQQQQQNLIQMRRDLHQIPELAFEEHKTAAYVAERLKQLGIPTQPLCNTGVVGVIYGTTPGKTILLRADMDALPIDEGGDKAYRSQHPGVMHACGHDSHMAMLLCAAELLQQRRDELKGNVKLMFQPAEEGAGGAKPMIEAGVMEHPKVDGAFSYHIWDTIPAGQVLIKQGSTMASPDHFSIRICGKGGHGARPHLCVNPVAVGAEIVTALHAIETKTESVISICAFNSGNFENVIPDEAELKGTARTLDDGTRQQVFQMITSICNQTAEKYGATCHIDYRFLYPPCINDAGMTDLFQSVATQTLGAENIVIQPRADMTGDDFAYIAQLVPACYVKLGGAMSPLHASDFDIDESALATGAALMTDFVLKYLS